jgi:hypothetical protein
VKLALALAASVSLLGLPLLAQESKRFSRVALLLPACERAGLSPTELREAVSLDLRDENLTLAPAGELSPASDVLVRLGAACSDDGPVTLQAEFGAEQRTHQVDIGELPTPQRARALSLALAELLSQFDHPQAAPSSAADEPLVPAAPPASVPVRHEAASPHVTDVRPGPKPAAMPRRWQLGLAPELRIFRVTSLWGGRARVRYAGWALGLDVLTAHVSALPGSVTTLLAHGSFSYSFTLLGSAEGSLLEGGPRLGAGRAFMHADASGSARASDAQDVYLDAALTAGYSLALSHAFRLGVGAEVGYASGPIGYADDRVVARTAGGFAALFIDASARL